MADEEQEGPTLRKGREGNRWINERPSGEEFAEWFETVPIHEGLDHTEFVGGITLIQSTVESQEVVGFDEQGLPMIRERKDVHYVPYARVDTRVAYFWAYMRQHPDWLGFIREVPEDDPTAAKGMPPGFFKLQVRGKKSDEIVSYIGASVRVEIFKRDTVRWRDETYLVDGKPHIRRVPEGEPVFAPSVGTKTVPTLGRYDADHNAVMKAQTGAVGRALGMAGMLIIPGSGVATAEDVQEAQSERALQTAGLPAVPAEAKAPPNADVDDPDRLREMVTERMEKLKANEQALADFQAWAKERQFKGIADLGVPQLKGILRKLDKALAELPDGSEA